MWYALLVNTFWIIDLFCLVLKISNRFYIPVAQLKHLDFTVT